METALKLTGDLITQQIELEQGMTDLGITRMAARNRYAVKTGTEDRTAYGKALIDGLITSVGDALRELIAARVAGKAGPKGVVVHRLGGHPECIDAFAYIALQGVVAVLMEQDTNISTLATKIGRHIEDEIFYSSVRESDNKLYKELAEQLKKRSAVHVKRTVATFILKKEEVERPEAWPAKDAATVGMTMIEMIVATGLVRKQSIHTNRKKAETKVVLVATEETREFALNRTNSAALLRPQYEPMIVPPAPWSTPTNGGYLSRNVRPIALVKSRVKGYLKSLRELDLTEVYEAVNAAQETAWSINPYILTLQQIGWDRDYSLGGIPTRFQAPLPPKPHDIDDNEEARLAWRKEAGAAHRENRELESKRLTFMSTIQTAEKYCLFDAIYFPHQLDFRGRIYAVPSLSPQGPDFMKGLLQFSEGKPLDEDSAPFLAIHVANCGAFEKIDKAALEDRVQWVYDNEEMIVACADNPIDNRWWTEADSPYCFLAACREWAGWLREGVGFMSHLPVALDGSCSGLQHFSMALADEVGGAAVNLVPADKPSDIYTLVLDRVTAAAQADADGDGEFSEMAAQWLRSGLMVRGLTKRPTMTYGYGAGQYGFRDQIDDDTLDPARRAYKAGNGEWHFDDTGFGASVYMARLVKEAVEGTVVKAAEAMQWLKEVARVVTSEGLPVRWTTPDGFPVLQHYRELRSNRIDTLIFGNRVRFSVTEETPQVSKRQQAAGLSPNFVHSLDATHLRMAVRRAHASGITSFALIHDSFGTHAADTGRFFVQLREAMVEMYTGEDVLEAFAKDIRAQLSDKALKKMPEAPAKGKLDLQRVVDCDFAFA